MFTFSRGVRYQCYNKEFLQLLINHNYDSLLIEIYNINSTDIIKGVEKLSKQVLTADIDGINKSYELQQKLGKYTGDLDNFLSFHKEEINEIKTLLSPDIYNVTKTTTFHYN